jgi:hypothetical protein
MKSWSVYVPSRLAPIVARLFLLVLTVFGTFGLTQSAVAGGPWVQTHTAAQTHLDCPHVMGACQKLEIDQAFKTCDGNDTCNSFNWRASDNTTCFKSCEKQNGLVVPEYHATDKGYDVFVKNPVASAAETKWVQTHTAAQTHLNCPHVMGACQKLEIDQAFKTCDGNDTCNGFNWRASDNTTCFKKCDLNPDGYVVPEYHASQTGYDVYVKNADIICGGVTGPTNMTIQCANQMWKHAGCTTQTNHTAWINWARSANLSLAQMKGDFHHHCGDGHRP